MILRPPATLLLLLLSSVAACGESASAPTRGVTLQVIDELPHDRHAYTQGLVVRGDTFYESTGLHGESDVRRVDPGSGEVVTSRPLDERYFGEGLVLLDGLLYQLTWQQNTGFVYRADDLAPVDTFTYGGEGWGLTTDGTYLIMSDGTYRLRYIDPATFEEVRRIEVTDAGTVVFALNELEWVEGEIWANVWQQDNIARIDPETGQVLGWVNVGGFLSWFDRIRGAEVANGIAYDSVTDRMWVTGKNWPSVFEVAVP